MAQPDDDATCRDGNDPDMALADKDGPERTWTSWWPLAVREAVKDCMETGNLVAVVSRAYGEARAKALTGDLGDLDCEMLLEAYRAILRWCGVYELAYRQRRDRFHQHT